MAFQPAPAWYDWQSAGGADPTTGDPLSQAPDAGRIAQGYEYGEFVPANVFNGLLENQSEWNLRFRQQAQRTATRYVTARPGAVDGALPIETVYETDGVADEVQINAALAAVAAATAGGGTVALSEGIFDIAAPVVVPAGCRLIGQGRRTTIRAAAGTGNIDIVSVEGGDSEVRSLRVIGSAGAVSQIGVDVNAVNDVVLADLHIYSILNGGGGGTGHAIRSAAGDNLQIHRCQIFSVAGKGIESAATNSIVSDCTVEDAGTRGIETSGVDCCIDKCHVLSPGGDGIYVLGARTVLSRCHIFSSVDNGIQVDSADYCTVEVCTVLDAGGRGITTSGQYDKVLGCTVVNPTGHGIFLGFDDSQALGCTVTSAGSSGIHVENAALSAARCKVLGCTILGAAGIGIYSDELETEIADCEVDGSGTTGIDLGAGADDSSVVNCKIARSATHGLRLLTNTNSKVQDCQLVDNNTGAGVAYDIYVQDADRAIISGNRCTNPGGAPRVVDSIHLTAGAANNRVWGNYCQQGSSGLATTINDLGAGNGDINNAALPGMNTTY